MTNRLPSDSRERVPGPSYHEDLRLVLSKDPKKGFANTQELAAVRDRRLELQAIRELLSGLPKPDAFFERQIIRHLRAYYDTHGFAPYREWIDPNGVRTDELWQRWRDA